MSAAVTLSEAAGVDIINSIRNDIKIINFSNNEVINEISLWPAPQRLDERAYSFRSETPEWAQNKWSDFQDSLLMRGLHWRIWVQWYDAVLNGYDPWNLPREVGSELLLDALAWPNEKWQRPAAEVNADIQALIEAARERVAGEREGDPPELVTDLGELPDPAPTREEIIAAASPTVGLNAKGQIDVKANEEFDKPVASDELYELPDQQISLINVIVAALPANAPKVLGLCFTEYRKHLKKRRYQPHLGTLKDHCAIIRAEFNGKDAGDWCGEGQTKAFERFFANDDTFMRHFPLDPKRDELYGAAEVDVTGLQDPELRKRYDEFAEAAQEAADAGIATQDFADTVKADAQFAKIVSDPKPLDADLVTSLDDRPAPPPVSAEKRFILSKFGFASKVQTAGGAVTIVKDGPEAANKLVAAAQSLWELLSSFIK